MIKNIDLEFLTQYQHTNKLLIKGIESHFDAITAHTGVINSYLTSLMGPFIIQSVNPNLKVDREVVMSKLRVVLDHVLALCEACSYDLPDADAFAEFDAEVPQNVKKDLILTTSDMICCNMDNLQIVHVDMEGSAIWSEQEPPEDFVSNIISLINGIKNIGLKYSFTVGDLLTEV
jgi:hypothetical protein